MLFYERVFLKKKITESLNESHLKSKAAKIRFICKNDKKCKKEDVEKLSAKELDKKYKALEKKMGIKESETVKKNLKKINEEALGQRVGLLESGYSIEIFRLRRRKRQRRSGQRHSTQNKFRHECLPRTNLCLSAGESRTLLFGGIVPLVNNHVNSTKVPDKGERQPIYLLYIRPLVRLWPARLFPGARREARPYVDVRARMSIGGIRGAQIRDQNGIAIGR